jgi:mRNA interferase MazF
MFDFGSIVLVPFPFTNLQGAKRRPALIVSTDNARRADVVVCFITSIDPASRWAAELHPSANNGLKIRSWVRLDKIATLEKSIFIGKIGQAEAAFLAGNRNRFLSVFGF